MTITFKVSPQLGAELKQAATRKRISTSKYVRDLIESDLRKSSKRPFKSALDAMLEMGVIGCVTSGIHDLATNPKYMEGYGEDNNRRRAACRAA